MPGKRKGQRQGLGQDPDLEQSKAKWAHHPFDRIFKNVAEHAPEALLSWLAEVLSWPPTKLVDAHRTNELVGAELAVDVVWIVEGAGERELLHLECELKDAEARMGYRMAVYALQLLERDKLPVHSVVIFIKKKATVSASPFVMGTSQRQYLRFEFDALKMWEIAAETVLQRPAPYLWPLAGLMAGVTPARVVEIAEQIVTTIPAGEEQKELVGMLIILSGVQFTQDEIQAAIRRNPMIDEVWKESSAARLLLEEGEAKGREEGMRESVRVLLEARFGDEASALLPALQTADGPTLRAILAHPDESLVQTRERLGM